MGDRWGVRGSIGLGILAVAVQVVVFRVILVENLPPKVKQSIDEPYEPWKPWRCFDSIKKLNGTLPTDP